MSRIFTHTFGIYAMRFFGCFIAIFFTAIGTMRSAVAYTTDCSNTKDNQAYWTPEQKDSLPILLPYDDSYSRSGVISLFGDRDNCTDDNSNNVFKSPCCEVNNIMAGDSIVRNAHPCGKEYNGAGSGYYGYTYHNGNITGICTSWGVLLAYGDIKDKVSVNGLSSSVIPNANYTMSEVGLYTSNIYPGDMDENRHEFQTEIVGAYYSSFYDEYIKETKMGCQFGNGGGFMPFFGYTEYATSCASKCQLNNGWSLPTTLSAACCPMTENPGSMITKRDQDKRPFWQAIDQECYIPSKTSSNKPKTYTDSKGVFTFHDDCYYTE